MGTYESLRDLVRDLRSGFLERLDGKILIRHIDIRIPAQLAVQLQRLLPARESAHVDLVLICLSVSDMKIAELGLLALILPPAP